jgi:hypothetical protein
MGDMSGEYAGHAEYAGMQKNWDIFSFREL